MGEPITNVLRSYLYDAMVEMPRCLKRAFSFCDNIDAVHRSLEAENERLRETKSLLGPTDVDGVPIYIGDMLAEGEASPERVKALMFDRDGWSVNFGLGWCIMKYHEWHHAKPDTWESIIEDAREYRLNINGSYLWKNKSDELVARCKALAGEDE